MAGKSNKAKKGKAAGSNSAPANIPEPESKPVEPSVLASDVPAAGVSPPNGEANGEIRNTDTDVHTEEAQAGVKEEEANEKSSPGKQKEGEIGLYSVQVKVAQSGEKLELQLSPGDSVMDVRQFLLDAPETCFYTCYTLVLHSKDGSLHPMEDYNEISEVADITTGGCSLELIPKLYDERSIRHHVKRSRDLLSLSNLHVSLSSSLALHHEADSGKQEAQEIDGLGFMEDVSSSIPNLILPGPKDIKCIESIIFSSFNPPPSYRKLVGDLIYIDVKTVEGTTYCITGSTKGFYVNSSASAVTLDPKPSKNSHESSTLFGLLQKLSPKFKKGFREILDQKASAHPFENVQSLMPPNSWLSTFPLPEHKRDAARAEDAVILTYGSDTIGMQRDWNEELQSCRDFPHTNPQERILRGRALYKVSCDFIDAAVKGAVGVINRCVLPINPTDPECFHMYVHNNIFFSFALDSYFENLSKEKKPTPDDGPQENSAQTKSTITDTDADTPDETQIADSEQATYDSANNDLRGTKAYQEADVPGLYNLAMAIIDYRGFRVVAQSIIPGILQGDKSESLLYGSVDNGKKICWNESFHAKVVEAAKRLHLKEHEVLDGSGNQIKLAAPVECKGIVGSDDRHYLLDLMRVTPRDSNYKGPEHRFSVLRPELISSFIESEATSKQSEPKAEEESEAHDPATGTSSEATSKQSEPKAEEESEAHDPATGSSETSIKDDEKLNEKDGLTPSSEILFNPNVLTEFKLAGAPEEIEADEALVRNVGTYLTDVVIPKFVQDLCALDISPMDGQTLTDALHSHGINMRYLGKIAVMVKHMPHLWALFVTEVVVRSAKHVVKDLLRATDDHDVGPAVAHFINCLMGDVQPTSVKGSSVQSKSHKKGHELQTSKSIRGSTRRAHGGQAFTKGSVSYTSLTSDGAWTSINEFAKSKYQFEVPEDVRSMVKKVPVLRNLCMKIGITIASRKYDLQASTPFQVSDILNLQPVVKHSIPVCTEANDLMEAGKIRLAEGKLNEAYTLFSESFALLQQITGPMHKDVANCCRYLGMVLYHAGDVGGALVQQHRELIINERCLGLDHPDTAHSYGNMGLFYHQLNQVDLALRHMSRTLLLLSLSSGPDHPDMTGTLINVAMMYQDTGNMNTALRYLQEALSKTQRLLGTEHIQTAVCYHALAIAFNCMGAFKLSIQHEKKTYDILAKQLGEEDSRTKDSENWIKTFKLREQQKQKVAPGSTMKAIDLLKTHPDLVQAFQAMSSNPAPATEGLPRGRGIDARAARAAAEIRRKAAARGQQLRQNPVAAPTGQNLSASLSQLLNIINSGEVPASGAGVKAESSGNGNVGNENGNGNGNETLHPVEEKTTAPVGLGTSLEPKKQKSKSKATSS
ncbi:tetratricopeptide repeat (TPR)-containing protein isoform X2 [Carex rostrata]